MANDLGKISENVSRCLQLALLLEVSAYPKPGNVHRTTDFKETRYEHFLASAVAVASPFRHAAEKGTSVQTGKISLNEVEVGKNIKEACENVSTWQHGGNTILGSIILLAPMAVAAGLTYAENKLFDIIRFRRNLKSVVESTTPKDAVNVYDAIAVAKPGGLGKAPKLDVTEAASKQTILESNISLYEIFKISLPWDSISSEWVNNYSITFDIGYPYLIQQLKENQDLNIATVHTFLKILSLVPDTLVSRKVGTEKAQEISFIAKKILEAGGLKTPKGIKSLTEFDKALHDVAHKLNPGTTADITSAVLAVHVLNGYRP